MVAVAAMVIVTKVFTPMRIASAVIFVAAVAVVGAKSRNKNCECSDECQ